jgi:hypothetical protein
VIGPKVIEISSEEDEMISERDNVPMVVSDNSDHTFELEDSTPEERQKELGQQ